MDKVSTLTPLDAEAWNSNPTLAAEEKIWADCTGDVWQDVPINTKSMPQTTRGKNKNKGKEDGRNENIDFFKVKHTGGSKYGTNQNT